MSLFGTLAGAVENTPPYYQRIDSLHTSGISNYNDAPIVPGKHYFRVWLTSMYLKFNKDLFNSLYPAVQSAVRLEFGDSVRDIPSTAGPGQLKVQNNLDRVLMLDSALTPLIPYRGGTVSIATVLAAMHGEAQLGSFLDVLGNIASTLVLSPLSAALKIISPIATGMEKLFGVANGEVQVGLSDSFTEPNGGGGNDFRAGFLAVAAPDPAHPISTNTIYVGLNGSNTVLFSGAPGALTQLRGQTYLIAWVEAREKREDYLSLESIGTPFQEAKKSWAANHKDDAQAQLKASKLAASDSPDLTFQDQTRLPAVLQGLFDEFTKGMGVQSLDTTPEHEAEIQRAIAAATADSAAVSAKVAMAATTRSSLAT